MFGLNLGRNIGHAEASRGSAPENAAAEPRLSQDGFLPYYFQFIDLPTIQRYLI
jgi:hypothetical protein